MRVCRVIAPFVFLEEFENRLFVLSLDLEAVTKPAAGAASPKTKSRDTRPGGLLCRSRVTAWLEDIGLGTLPWA